MACSSNSRPLPSRAESQTRARIAAEPKGDVVVPVIVTDESGEQPIQCAMTWAWVPKKR